MVYLVAGVGMVKDRHIFPKTSQLWDVARNSTVLAANALVSGILGLFFWVVASWNTSGQTVGVASAIISAISMLSAISLLGLPETVIRFWHSRGYDLRFLIRSTAFSTGFALLVFTGFQAWAIIAQRAFLNFNVLVASAAALLFLVSTGLANSGLVALNRANLVLVSSTIAGVTKLLVLLFINNSSEMTLVLSLAASAGISAIFSFWAVTHLTKGLNGPKQSSAVFKTSILPFATSNWLSSCASILPSSIAPILLLNRSGSLSAAYATIPLLLLAAMNLPAAAIARSVFAVASRDPSRLAMLVFRGGSAAFGMSLTMMLGVAVLGPVLYEFVRPGYATSGFRLLSLLSLACVIAVPNYFIDAYLNVKQHNRFFAVVNIGGSVVQSIALVLLVNSVESLGYAWIYGQLGYLFLAVTVLMIQKLMNRRS